ncbi:MAG: bifunctional riboflavin kinase/FMN adenylyltransferase [Leptolyngbya sp. PLA1]|nr:bifunctional riboflavin kinase/FMN adenylyltransferase [Leptolyngbya sp. PLA1]
MPTPTAITIGNFDGVHVGHVALVRAARRLAGPGGRVLALAFDPHPISRLRPEHAPALLSAFEQRARWLREAGADAVEQLDPTPELLALDPESFVRSKIDRYGLAPGAAWFVEGSDFHFGKGRAGTVATLQSLGATLGFGVEVVPPVESVLTDHLVVRASSSLVRWLVSQGRVRDAAIVLGRPYELTGRVIRGDQRGRTIGFPTANIATGHLLPADGVYGGLAIMPDGARLPAAVNIGTRPTFRGVDRRVEAHLLDPAGGAWTRPSSIPEYDWPIALRLVSWIRDQVRFDSPARLTDQLARDCGHVRATLAPSA